MNFAPYFMNLYLSRLNCFLNSSDRWKRGGVDVSLITKQCPITFEHDYRQAHLFLNIDFKI